MTSGEAELVLASSSPRRQQMLRDFGLQFKIRSPDIKEKRLRGEPAKNYVSRLAREKAYSVANASGFFEDRVCEKNWFVLAADTIVYHDGQVLEKPKNADDAMKMLMRLSGKTHEVFTAFFWVGALSTEPKNIKTCSEVISTKVTFANCPREFWKWYVSTGEPLDKAGAYAAQGIGSSFIERVSGSYSNVVGLPLCQVLEAFSATFGRELREYCGQHRKS